jgi:hypothetical protein
MAETCANRQLVPLNTARQIIQDQDYLPSTVNARQLTACHHTLVKRLNPYLANSRLRWCVLVAVVLIPDSSYIDDQSFINTVSLIDVNLPEAARDGPIWVGGVG